MKRTATLTPADALRRIIALCENPHWTADRKYRIAELASEVLRTLSKPNRKTN